jgi:DNA-binding MarR family transcriptional regulator
MLRKSGVTPARFDVIHCLVKAGGRMRQGALRSALAVVKSTLSETLAKMEKLGLVTRSRRSRKGRVVQVTAKGALVQQRTFLDECDVEETIAMGFGAYWRPDKERLWILALERLCKSVRRAFGEARAPRLYEWLEVED